MRGKEDSRKPVANDHVAQQSRTDKKEKYIYLEEVEISFKGARPNGKIMIIVDIPNDRLYKSDVYDASGKIRWKCNIYAKPSALAELKINKLQAKMLWRNYATISLDFTNYNAVRNQDSIVEEDPKFNAKLSFGDASSLEASMSRQGPETSSALRSKDDLLDKVGKVLNVINAVIQLASTAGQAIPFASAVSTSAKDALDKCQSIGEAHKIAIDLMDEIVLLLPLPSMLLSKVQEKATEELMMNFLKLIKDTMDTLTEYAAHSTSGFLSQNLFNPKHDDFVRLKARLDAMKEAVNLFVGASAGLALNQIQNSVATRNDLEILGRLSPVGEADYDPAQGCLEGTRSKIIDDVITKVKRSGLYWVKGLAGSGKSTVSTSIAEKLDKEGTLAGCFFFKRDIPELREPRRVLSTLSHSLSQVHAPYRKHILSVLEKKWDIAEKAPKRQLDALFGKDMGIESPKDPYVFVVDALDECGEEQDTIASCLAELTQNIPWLKVVLTSRLMPEVEQILEEAKEDGSYEHPMVIKLDLNAVDVDVNADIRKYNAVWLSRIRKLPKKWLEPEWLQILTERACGLFIWSSTVAKYVTDALDCDRALEQVLDEAKPLAGGPFAALDKLYQLVLEQVRGDRLTLKKALGILVCTAKNRPLTLQGLYDLIPTGSEHGGLSYKDLETVLERLQSVLCRGTSAEGVVRVCHPSFLDFMSSEDRSGTFFTDPAELNAELYGRCMHIMDKGLQFNICKLESAYILNTEVRDLHQKIIDNIPSSLQYGCIYWMDHLLEAKATIKLQDPSVQTTVSRLLCDIKALFWLEVLSLSKEVRAGMITLSHCVKAYQPPSRLSLASAELFKFTTAYYDVISTSTPHMYISALSWTPTDSYIGRELASRFSNQPIVTSGRLRSWKPILWSATASEGFYDVECSPDGSLFVSAMFDHKSESGMLLLWNALTGELVGEPFAKNENTFYHRVEFSPDGKCIAASHYDGELTFWDVQTRKPYEKGLNGITSIVCCKYSPSRDELVSSSLSSNSLSIWDLRSREVIVKTEQMDSLMTCLCYSPDGTKIVSGSRDGTLHVWDARTGKIIGEPLTGHTERVDDVAFSPGGRYIASASKDKTIQLWSAEERHCLHVATCPGKPWNVEFSPDGKYILGGSSEGSIYLLEPVETGGSSTLVMHTLRGSYGSVPSTTYSPDGRYFISASYDGSIRVWDASAVLEFEETSNLEGGHSSDIASLYFSPDGTTVLSGSEDRSIRFWNAETGAEIGEPILQDQVAAMYSPDGSLILSRGRDNNIYIWEAETRKVVKKLSILDEEIVKYAIFSFDGQYVAANSDSEVYIWDVRTGDLLGDSIQAFGTGSIYFFKWSRDDKHILVVSKDRAAVAYDVERRKPVFDVASRDQFSTYRYAPNGEYFIRSLKSDIASYDAASGEMLGEPITLDMNLIANFEFSLDGKYLALDSFDRKLWILELESKKIVAGPALGHSESGFSLSYSPDGRLIATASSDDSIRIWDTEFLMQLRNHQQNAVVTVFKEGTHHIDSEKVSELRESANESAEKAIARRILPAGVAEDGWYRNAEGGRLLWVPHEYRTDAVDMSKICISAVARRDLDYDFELLSRYEGPSWASIYSA